MIYLCCDELVVERQQFPLFAPIGFYLLSGGALVLRGSNGAGKTSLLHAIAGLLPLAQGSVRTAPGVRMAYLDGQSGMSPHLTVVEQLQFVAACAETEPLIPPAVHYMRLHSVLDLPIALLSSGWRRRVAIAQLMVQNAMIWLLDEPETHLDAEGVERLLHLVSTRIQEGGIVLWATHQQAVYQRFPQLYLEDFSCK